MASFPAKSTLLFLQLSLLLLSSVLADEFNLLGRAHSPHSLPSFPPVAAPKPHKGHHHHHHPPNHPPGHPPVHPPVYPPVHPPVKPPVHPPVKPPVHPPYKPPVAKPPVHPPVPVKKLVAVQGVVYCKHCKYAGINTLLRAKPLVGAVVRLQCNNTKYKPVVAEAKTDKNGYFLIMPKMLTTAGSHKCRVFLVKSPSKKCDVPTNFHAGLKGAILTSSLKPPASHPLAPIYELFTVGPFAYEPSKKLPCN